MIKKQLIMEKALELFAKQGFEATSVQQITDHCGISKGAFYLSFKSKDELILTLIDHFMMQITSDIDHIVKTSKDDRLLYDIYYASYSYFYKHLDFAKIFIKEQSQTFNNEFILKMRYYDKLHEKAILTMIERLYGEEVKHTKYDLIYCIKAFMKMYGELFFSEHEPLDFHLLAESLVEKTNILAKYMTISFVSEDYRKLNEYTSNEVVTKEKLVEIINQKIEEMEESIEKESLILLKEQLTEPTLSPAIVKGLIENIRNHPHCKWISYLLGDYYKSIF
ncbi:TetR/AcrR family transcriptional regulator [Lederbergia wuyishanensis]|uniref:AcrR family transcriptional regulator n=1 Tax=Lederbergia wuyishanensis TaxID=1347903 RepID=A0ABU0D323_9BACI|nr:TetR/AcrR family transcriptional regulator [Lederbergia wuyishanensis]MCJ8007062.1 TetR/AcrR family transcriptional regulator [Lederbergia wuyishanensis]MDQ0342794.1 AcrR family transcriptional regulator [Lederbergia wuyishanensis]